VRVFIVVWFVVKLGPIREYEPVKCVREFVDVFGWKRKT